MVLLLWMISFGFCFQRGCRFKKWRVYWFDSDAFDKFSHKSNLKKFENTRFVELSPFLSCFSVIFGSVQVINHGNFKWCCRIAKFK